LVARRHKTPEIHQQTQQPAKPKIMIEGRAFQCRSISLAGDIAGPAQSGSIRRCGGKFSQSRSEHRAGSKPGACQPDLFS
jgi:hypothetical protein